MALIAIYILFISLVKHSLLSIVLGYLLVFKRFFGVQVINLTQRSLSTIHVGCIDRYIIFGALVFRVHGHRSRMLGPILASLFMIEQGSESGTFRDEHNGWHINSLVHIPPTLIYPRYSYLWKAFMCLMIVWTIRIMVLRTIRKKSRSQVGIPQHKWQHNEDDQLLELARTDMTWKEISDRIGRSESACTKRYYRYLITKSVDDLTRMRVVRLYSQ